VQSVKAFRRLLEFGIETTNAKPHENSLHPVNKPAGFANKTLPLPVGPLGIFFGQCWDRYGLAVITLAA